MTTFSRFHYDYVTSHINQTMLVYKLLETGFLDYSDIESAYDPETDEYREIYQWVAFPNFSDYDLEKLADAKMPVLSTEYGAWVGITAFGSHYDLYVYPELINALFDLDISYEDIRRLE